MNRRKYTALFLSLTIHGVLFLLLFINFTSTKKHQVILSDDISVFNLGMLASNNSANVQRKSKHVLQRAKTSQASKPATSAKSLNQPKKVQEKQKTKPVQKNKIATVKKKQLKPQKKPKPIEKIQPRPKKAPNPVSSEVFSPNPIQSKAAISSQVSEGSGSQKANIAASSGVAAPSAGGKSSQQNSNNDQAASYRAGLQAAIAKVAKRNYPNNARRRRQQGIVTVRFNLSSSGQFSAIKLVRSSGYKALDNAAILALQRLGGFLPPPEGFPRTLVVPIRFQLN